MSDVLTGKRIWILWRAIVLGCGLGLMAVALPLWADTEPVTSPRCNEFTFDASGSHDPDNQHIDYQWDFGDGQRSDQALVSHTYKRSGDYKVVLSITDNSGLHCSTAQTEQIVRVNIPPHAAFEAPTSACTDERIVFNGADSRDDSKTRLSYQWDFGDGTTQQGAHRVEKVYTKPGDYTVALTVNDHSGTVCQSKTVNQAIHVNKPPVAEAGPKEVLKCISGEEEIIVNFDASNTNDANNDALQFFWDFGDGHRSQGVRVTHQYKDVDNYDVKLIVKDNSALTCDTGVDFVKVRVNKAPKAEAGKDIIACVGELIRFDGTDSYAYRKGTLGAQWFFGDGQKARGLKTTHVYEKPGKYQAALSLENKLNAMCPPSRDSRNVTINAIPMVSIKSVEAVCLGTSVDFDASVATDADGDALEFYWSFGDGEIMRAGPKVSHTYAQGGEYRVSVIVDDGQKSPCSTATAKTVVKVNTPPVADAGPNTSCCVELPTRFDASGSLDADGDALTYSWDFGDGMSQEGMLTEHVYKQSGTYNVQVTVDDNSGTACSKSTAGFVAQANASPVPVIQIR